MQFIKLSVQNGSRRRRIIAIAENWRLSTQEQAGRLSSAALTEDRLAAWHLSSLDMFKTQRTEALTLGSLGLAAWALLTGTSASGRLNTYGLQLLLLGVVLTIVGPILFRRAGTEGSRMGLETSTSIGYAAIAIALLAFLPSIFRGSGMKWLALGVVVLLFIREAIEVTTEMNRTHRLLGGRSTPGATNAARDTRGRRESDEVSRRARAEPELR